MLSAAVVVELSSQGWCTGDGWVWLRAGVCPPVNERSVGDSHEAEPTVLQPWDRYEVDRPVWKLPCGVLGDGTASSSDLTDADEPDTADEFNTGTGPSSPLPLKSVHDTS
eukprot:gene17352-biopygen17550